MLSRKYSLKSKKAIFFVSRKGKTVNTNYFQIKTILNSYGVFKCVIIVTKKNFKTAILRNKVKRMIRHLLKESPVFQKPVLVLVKPHSSFLTASFDTLKSEFSKIA